MVVTLLEVVEHCILGFRSQRLPFFTGTVNTGMYEVPYGIHVHEPYRICCHTHLQLSCSRFFFPRFGYHRGEGPH